MKIKRVIPHHPNLFCFILLLLFYFYLVNTQQKVPSASLYISVLHNFPKFVYIIGRHKFNEIYCAVKHQQHFYYFLYNTVFYVLKFHRTLKLPWTLSFFYIIMHVKMHLFIFLGHNVDIYTNNTAFTMIEKLLMLMWAKGNSLH